MTIHRLPAVALQRIGEIDRSEDSQISYKQNGSELLSRRVTWRIRRWSLDPRDGFSVQGQVNHWEPIVSNGGYLLGALLEDRLLGFAILRPELSPGTAELAALFVDRGYRRMGIATALLRAIEAAASQVGANRLYVSSVPSEAAVGFYLDQGFHPAANANPELVRRKPTDIHLVKRLQIDS